ncbi:MAG: class I SAM-dependent methyltransferase [Alphaproteobacteria bacterium]
MSLRERLPPAVKRFLLETPAGRGLLVLPRLLLALCRSGTFSSPRMALVWAFASRDIAPRTYHTTKLNQEELCWTVSVVSGVAVETVMGYCEELLNDAELAESLRLGVSESPERWSHDPDYRPGRRLAGYLMTRSLRPRRVIEVGVDRGFGAMILCRALTRNAADGFPGEYVGIDRKAADSAFLYHRFPGRLGRLEHGDAAEILRGLPGEGSLIVHDTGTDPAPLAAFIAAVEAILAEDTVLLSSWVRPEFMELARRRNLVFLSHKDRPLGHWTPGSRLSFLFPRLPSHSP